MTIDSNAQTALSAGRGTISGIISWFDANKAELPLAFGAAAIIIGIMMLIRWIGVALRNSDPDCTRLRSIIGRALAKTSVFFMAACAVEIIATYADVPTRVSRLADIVFTIAFAFQGAIWARELILGAIARKVGEDTGESTLANAMSLIKVLVSVALFAIAIVVVLDNLGVNVTALVAGLGIGGIAIGFAAQGIFSDLFAALAILFDRPFRRGDTINYGGKVDGAGTTGTVERIGIKTTRIRSRSGEMVVMSNAKLLEQELTNIDEASVYRVWLPFGVVYQTDPAKLERMDEIIAGVLKGMKEVRFVRCAISGFGPSSIDFSLVYDDIAKNFDSRALHKSDICIGILRAFRAEKLQFAYPTQTTFTAAPDGTMVMPWPAPRDSQTAKK